MTVDVDRGHARAPRVLLVGGGFVGLYAALGLERRLGAGEAELQLVAPENYMRYQPLLAEVASGTVEPRHVVVPLRRALKRTQVILGELTGLDHAGGRATIAPEAGEPVQVSYDMVVLGLGSVTKTLPVPGLVGQAVGFQTLPEAIHLRNQVLARLEAAESATDETARRRALTFVFVGGGYAGVEALAELEDLARDACDAYRTVRPSELRWILVEATDRILPSMNAELGRRAESLLRARGVELRLQTEVESVDGAAVRLSDGHVIEADTLVWMPGVAPHPLAAELELPHDEQGRLAVDECLRLRGRRDAWAAGDCAAVPDGAGGLQPPTAQHAEREARHIADNITRVIRGQEPRPFRYRSRGEFVTLGNRKAVARVLGARLHGAPAWVLRRAYYLARMPSVERRVRLALDWLVGLVFHRDIAQLGTVQHPDEPLARAASESR